MAGQHQRPATQRQAGDGHRQLLRLVVLGRRHRAAVNFLDQHRIHSSPTELLGPLRGAEPSRCQSRFAAQPLEQVLMEQVGRQQHLSTGQVLPGQEWIQRNNPVDGSCSYAGAVNPGLG